MTERILIKFERAVHKSILIIILILSLFVVEILENEENCFSLVKLAEDFEIFFMTFKGQQSLESLWLRVVTIQALSTCNF